MKMSVLVKLNESNGELMRDLVRLEPRQRAERVRVLAMIGLVAVGVRPEPVPEAESGQSPQEVSMPDKLKERLCGSLG